MTVIGKILLISCIPGLVSSNLNDAHVMFSTMNSHSVHSSFSQQQSLQDLLGNEYDEPKRGEHNV